ncbi:MAG: 2TM domain-containing protein [Defluviicoccus sp.]|nr:2TM domain-containing protein [Defluviicoccus sp.]
MTTGTGNAQSDFPDDERRAMEDVRNIRSFYIHALLYGVVIAGLAAVNLFAYPGYLWFLWAALGWGVGLIAHGLSAFKIVDLFGHEWEKRQVAKRLANSRHNRNAKS